MENEELLPKPLTNLPLPRPPATEAAGNVGQAEKDIPEHATPASQGVALRSYGSKWLILGIVVIVSFALLGGVYMLGRSSVLKELNPTNPTIPPPNEPKYQSPTPTSNPVFSPSADTSTWKTYDSLCKFSLSYPEDWKATKYFIEDHEGSCAYLTAPDYKLWTDSRDGFYLGITRTKLGTKGINYIINSLEDYIKDDESIMTPRVSVGEKISKTYGEFSGISYLPVGFEPGRSFIFIQNGYIYDVNWSDTEESNHLAETNEIIKSLTFN